MLCLVVKYKFDSLTILCSSATCRVNCSNKHVTGILPVILTVIYFNCCPSRFVLNYGTQQPALNSFEYDILRGFYLFRVLQIAQACKPVVIRLGFWNSVKALARGYEYMMGLFLFTPVAVLSWFPFVSEFQTRLLFNQAFSRGLQISRILAGRKKL